MRSVSMIAKIELEQSAASSNGNIVVEFILFYTQSVSKVHVHLPNFVYLTCQRNQRCKFIYVYISIKLLLILKGMKKIKTLDS